MINSMDSIDDVNSMIAVEAPQSSSVHDTLGGRADRPVAALDSSGAHAPLVYKRAHRISAAWLIVPCLACDFLMVPVFWSMQGVGGPGDAGAALALGIVGCVLAQGNLLAAWLAWSEGPFFRRLATHWKIAAS